MSSRLLATWGGLVRLLLLVIILAVLAGAVTGAAKGVLGDWLSSLNPFNQKTIDRTGPSVLQSLAKFSDFRAASAHYETVVDRKKDTENLPDWVSGEQVLYVAKGDVDAFVDFGELDERRVVVSEDGISVTIRLPAPRVDKPRLDLEHSYVADHDKGFTDRFKGSDLEREAQLEAVEKMTTAATGEGRLTDLAKQSTTTMLRGLLGALGYTDITIIFDEDVS